MFNPKFLQNLCHVAKCCTMNLAKIPPRWEFNLLGFVRNDTSGFNLNVFVEVQKLCTSIRHGVCLQPFACAVERHSNITSASLRPLFCFQFVLMCVMAKTIFIWEKIQRSLLPRFVNLRKLLYIPLLLGSSSPLCSTAVQQDVIWGSKNF